MASKSQKRDDAAGDERELAEALTRPAADTVLDTSLGASAQTRVDHGELAAVEPGNYTIGDEIARGGMGRISEGRDLRIGRDVAIKEVLIELLEIYPDDERRLLLRRFEREARITARLEHPAIVPVYEIGRLAGRPFFAMKRINGRPLGELIGETENLSERLRLLPNIIAACEALGYAHDKGVVHRDLKPANVLIGSHGETVVIDWGLAKQLGEVDADISGAPIVEDDGLRTVAGAVFGTPLYMPPEQARGESVDASADVYALGSMLYHLLTGAAPYSETGKTGARRTSIIEELKRGPPAPIESRVERLPRDLISIVAKAMARDRADRYPSAIELVADLRQFEAGQLVAVHDYSRSELFWRWVIRHRTAVATALIAVVAIAITASVLFQKVRSARDRAQLSAERAEHSRDEATRLFTELGRAALFRDDLSEAAFVLIQAGLLGADVPGFDALLGEIGGALEGFIARIGDGQPSAYLFSRDGSVLILAFPDGRIVVVDTETGAEISSFQGPRNTHALSVDGASRLIVASSNGEAPELFDLVSGQWLRDFDCGPSRRGATFRYFAVLTNDGERVVLACPDGELRIVRTSDGATLATLNSEIPIGYLLLSADESRLLVVHVGNVVQLIDMANGISFGAHQLSEGTAELSFSSDFRFASSSAAGRVRLFDLTRNPAEIPLNLDAGAVGIARLSASGKFLVIGETDGHVTQVDIATRTTTDRWRLHHGPIRALTITNDERTMASLGDDLVVRTWDFESRQARAGILGATGDGPISFSPNNRRLFVVNPNGSLLLDAEPRGASTLLSDDGDHTFLKFTRDSRYLRIAGPVDNALRDASGQLRRVNGASGGALGLYAGGGGFSSDGKRLLSAAGVYDTESLTLLAPTPSEVNANNLMTLSADGLSAAGLTDSASIVVWSAQSGERRLTFKLESLSHPTPSANFALNHDGSRLFLVAFGGLRASFVDVASGEVTGGGFAEGARMTVSADGRRAISMGASSVVWDLETGRRLADVPRSFHPAILSEDGQIFAARDDRGQISIYETDTAALVQTLRSPTHSVNQGALTLAGSLVAAANQLGEVFVWDRISGFLIMKRNFGDVVHSLALAPDGSELVAATARGVFVFPVPQRVEPRDLYQRLRARYPDPFFSERFLVDLARLSLEE